MATHSIINRNLFLILYICITIWVSIPSPIGEGRYSRLGGARKFADDSATVMVIDLLIQTEAFLLHSVFSPRCLVQMCCIAVFIFILPFANNCSLGVSTSGWSDSAQGYPLQEDSWHHLWAASVLLPLQPLGRQHLKSVTQWLANLPGTSQQILHQ